MENKQIKTTNIILVLILAFVLFFGGIMAYGVFSNDSEAPIYTGEPTPIVTPIVTPTPTPIVTPTPAPIVTPIPNYELKDLDYYVDFMMADPTFLIDLREVNSYPNFDRMRDTVALLIMDDLKDMYNIQGSWRPVSVEMCYPYGPAVIDGDLQYLEIKFNAGATSAKVVVNYFVEGVPITTDKTLTFTLN